MHVRTVLATLIVHSLLCTGAPAQVVWSEEFNSDRIDPATWTFDVGGHGFGNGQMEFNTARKENAYIDDGKLVIEARREEYRGKEFTSARMLTQGRFAFQYGTLEARIKVPDTANGIWPAFWILGNNFPGIEWPRAGEIDILEIGGKEGIAQGLQRRRINCAIHYAGANDEYASKAGWHNADVDLHLDYHTYKLTWTPERLKFYLDNVEFGSFDITGQHFREFHQPCFLILNVAVGGWESSYTGIHSPDLVTAQFPSRMVVDWIRLSRNEHTKVFLGDTNAETGNFGVFSESDATKTQLAYTDGTEADFPFGSAAALYLWNNLTDAKVSATPSEGTECWSFDVAPSSWFGMGVFVPNFRNMENYSDGILHFDIRTRSSAPMQVGIKSSRGGECFLPLGDEQSEFGFPRDDRWHTVSIPLNRFANIDFKTIHQLLMLKGDAPSSAMRLSIDHVWWQPSAPPPPPPQGTFGVFTETRDHMTGGKFAIGEDGNFFVWEKTLDESGVLKKAYEGRECMSLRSAPGTRWFGAAFTPNFKVDLSSFSGPAAKLRFAMKTHSSTTFMVGMKSGNLDGVAEHWTTFEMGKDPHGFVRDGKWHVVEIPLAEIAEDVNLSKVSQLFQILGLDGPIDEIALDDIYFIGDATPQPDRRP